MRREGSPLTGLGAVFTKEFADHLSSVRMRVLEVLILVVCVGLLASLVITMRKMDFGEDRFLLLYLFSLSEEALFPLHTILGILLPVFAIGLAFDAVNSEFTRRTMSRILAQPVYRDAVLMGKFLAGMGTLAVSLLVLWLLIVGGGILALGVPPTAEEVGRSLVFIFTALIYATVWLAIAMMFSTVFRSGATSVLCSLGLWLFFWQAWPRVAQMITESMVPIPPNVMSSPDALVAYLSDRSDIEQLLTRFSPMTLYTEAAIGLLHPSTRTLSNSTALLQQLFPALRGGAVLGAPLDFSQSLLLVWPHLVAMIAGSILVFAVTYVIFQRQEVRA
jgi:ABC-2 type transport system permease protein